MIGRATQRRLCDEAARRFPFEWRFVVEKRPSFNSLVGTVTRRPFGRGGGGEVVTIKTQTSFFLARGGHRDGFELDRGWLVTVRARLATEAETAVFVAREAKARAQRGEPV